MHVSWLDPHKMRRLTVVGRDKMAVFDDMEPERKVTVYDKGPVLRPATEWQVREGDINIPQLAREEPLRRECAHFLSLVSGDGRPARAEPRRASPSSRRSRCSSNRSRQPRCDATRPPRPRSSTRER